MNAYRIRADQLTLIQYRKDITNLKEQLVNAKNAEVEVVDLQGVWDLCKEEIKELKEQLVNAKNAEVEVVELQEVWDLCKEEIKELKEEVVECRALIDTYDDGVHHSTVS